MVGEDIDCNITPWQGRMYSLLFSQRQTGQVTFGVKKCDDLNFP